MRGEELFRPFGPGDVKDRTFMRWILPHEETKKGAHSLLDRDELIHVLRDVAGGVEPERIPVRTLHNLRRSHLEPLVEQLTSSALGVIESG